MKNKLNKQSIVRIIALSIVLVICVACGFELLKDHSMFNDEFKDIQSPVVYNKSYAKAGEYADFTFYVKAMSNQPDNDKLIIAFQVPKSWTEAKDAEVTFELLSELNKLYKMELLTTFSKDGQTWDQGIFNTVKRNDNILDDVQWYAFQAVESHDIENNDHLYIKVRVKVKTGPENLRVKIGFFANRSHNILGGIGEEVAWVVEWGDCFEVIDGEGELIDFCEYHFNLVSPGAATQNDILTFRYIGDRYNNDLMTEVNNIYLNATAITDKGNSYTIDEISDKTKMTKDAEYGIMYSKTCWPEGYFNIPAGETITSIKYYFTNGDKTKYVSDYDEKHKRDTEGTEKPTVKPIEMFLYNFVCK